MANGRWENTRVKVILVSRPTHFVISIKLCPGNIIIYLLKKNQCFDVFILKMAKISQTDNTIEIVIHLNRISSAKPDITLFKRFVKFNCPPVYFEGFLADEVDEEDSVCKLMKKEARFILKKKNCGIWPTVFEDMPKEETIKRKKEIDELLRLRAQEKEKEALNIYEEKRRKEIQKVVDRESNVRDKITSLEKAACKEEITQLKSELKPEPIKKSIKVCTPQQTSRIRSTGKINFQFSDFKLRTPKRESQNK